MIAYVSASKSDFSPWRRPEQLAETLATIAVYEVGTHAE